MLSIALRPLHIAFLVSSLAGCAAPVSNRLVLDEGTVVRARLLDSEGSSMANTPIRIVVDQRPAPDVDEADREIATGRTDEAGRFELGFRSSEAGSCSLWADVGDGWRLVDVPSELGWDEAGANSEMVFSVPPRDLEFRFQVVDATGGPVEGAAVRLVAGELSAPVEHLPARETDGDGRLHWDAFALGRWWADVKCPGYAPVRTSPYQSSPSDPPTSFYRVPLQRGQLVVVEVIDEASRPVGNAAVTYSYANDGLPTFSRWTRKADSRGQVSITVPAAGGYVIEATAAGRTGSVSASGQAERVRVVLRDESSE